MFLDYLKDFLLLVSMSLFLFLTVTRRWNWCIPSMPIQATASVLSLNPKVDTLPQGLLMPLFLYGTLKNSTARGHYPGTKELLLKIYFWWYRNF